MSSAGFSTSGEEKEGAPRRILVRPTHAQMQAAAVGMRPRASNTPGAAAGRELWKLGSGNRASWRLISVFLKHTQFVSHHIDSYAAFLQQIVPETVIETVPYQHKTENYSFTYRFLDTYMHKPTIIEYDGKVREVVPQECRNGNYTYASPLYIRVQKSFTSHLTGERTDSIENVYFGHVPTMVRSHQCRLYKATEAECYAAKEDPLDKGGYFIVGGSEKILMGMERMATDQVYVFPNKHDPDDICAEVSSVEERGKKRSPPFKIHLNPTTSLGKKGLLASHSYFKGKEFPVGILIKALGMTTGIKAAVFRKELFGTLKGKKMRELEELVDSIEEQSFHTPTQEAALAYLSSIATTQGSTPEKEHSYVHSALQKEFLPRHGIDETSYLKKAEFIIFMLQKLLQVHYGLRDADDHDSERDKRSDESGYLLGEIFKQAWGKITRELQMMVTRRLEGGNNLKDIAMGPLVNNLGFSKDLNYVLCVPAGTLVTLANGTRLPIEKLQPNQLILGWKDGKLQPSRVTRLLDQGVKATTRLTLLDGQPLTCTPDHKVLVQGEDGPEWMEAQHIKVGMKVVTGVEGPEDLAEEATGWSYEIKYTAHREDRTFILSVDTPEDRARTLAFARIVGFMLSDGYVRGDGQQGNAVLGTMYDVEWFSRDYHLLAGENLRVRHKTDETYGSSYEATISSSFSRILEALPGFPIGKRSTQAMTLPKFLIEAKCPFSVIREFLAGVFGGDGHAPRLDERKERENHRVSFSGVALSWTSKREFLPQLKDVFTQLCLLLEIVGVPGCHLNGPYHHSAAPADSDYFRLHTPSDSIFASKIGFRYCIDKSYRLTVASNFWKMEERIKNQHDWVIDRANSLHDTQKITFKKALARAHEDLKECAHPLSAHYSLPSDKMYSKRRESGRNSNLQYLWTKYGVLDAAQYVEAVGAKAWFGDAYCMEQGSCKLPTLVKEVVNVRAHATQQVYDITVEDTHSFVANGVVIHNCTGNWGVTRNSHMKTGVSQILNRFNHQATLSHCRRNINPMKNSVLSKPRMLHNSSWGTKCPWETPEGHAIGLQKNKALGCLVSLASPESFVAQILDRVPGGLSSKRTDATPWIVFLNGKIRGYYRDGSVWDYMRTYKLSGYFAADVGIRRNVRAKEVQILTDSGRGCQPLLTVKNGKKTNMTEEYLKKLESGEKSWNDALTDGVVEIVDSGEQESLLVATKIEKLGKDGVPYTHAMFSDAMIAGACVGTHPYGDNDPAARLVYQSSMTKQQVSAPQTNQRQRLDTMAHVLRYPQKPLCQTEAMELMDYNELPGGQNAVVCILCDDGWAQEDAIIMNKASIDRGLFVSDYYRTYKDVETKTAGCEERFGAPKEPSAHKLDPLTGVVRKKTYVCEGDMLIGKVSNSLDANGQPIRPRCTYVKHGEDGVVDEVFFSTNADGTQLVKVRVRQERIPEVGDKFAAMHSQKGVLGAIKNPEDMVFDMITGMIPDLVINPHSQPSRMTIGHLKEIRAGKYAALKGAFANATMFGRGGSPAAMKEIEAGLVEQGYNAMGWACMADGTTGERLKAKIYSGVCYYQRLKHMVQDKIHCRGARGPIATSTHQPSDGRSREGGLRIGEMERDILVGRGAAFLTQERLMNLSDKFKLPVCANPTCGLPCIANPKKKVYVCKACKGTEVAYIHIPYASKLMLQELMGLGIAPRLQLE